MNDSPQGAVDAFRRRLLLSAGAAGAALPFFVDAASGPYALGGYPGFVVSAANAPTAWKDAADFQASGSNDQTAIQAALDAAAAAGGGLVMLSPGLFGVGPASAGDPTAGAVRIPALVTLAGCGAGATTIQLAAGSSAALNGLVVTPYAASSQRLALRDLALDGNRGATSGIQGGVYCGAAAAISATDVRCSRVSVSNCSGHGFIAASGAAATIFEDCISSNNGDAAHDGFHLAAASDAFLSRCAANGGGGQGFNVVAGCKRVKLDACTAAGNAGHGYAIHDLSTQVTLTACTARANTLDGLNAYGAAAEAQPTAVDLGFIAVGCDFSGNGGNGVTAFAIERGAVQASLVNGNQLGGVVLNNVAGFAAGAFSVTGNTVSGNQGVGIAVFGVPYCVISDNDLRNNCQGGAASDQIQLMAQAGTAVSNSVISNNLIASTLGALPRYGINEGAGCDGNLVVGNRIVGTQTAALNLSGAGSSANAANNYAS